MKKPLAVFALGLLIAAGFTSRAAIAAPNLVLNGDFETSSISTATQVNSTNTSTGTNLANWANAGYTFLFTPGSADTTGSYSTEYNNYLKLWGPGSGASANNYSANGMPATSPTGGNFIGSDGAYETGAISQTVNGLTSGSTYLLTFYWAAAQQAGYSGDTTEAWKVSFGNQNYTTSTVTTVSHGFTPWQQVSVLFTATGTSQLLSFLAIGAPSGTPPFSLLDGVSLTVYTPEPATWAIMAVGLVGAGLLARTRRRSKSGAPTAA